MERRVVVVTGASAGVGRAAARRFAAEGAAVGLIARGRDGLDAARREIEEAGGEAIAVQADVSDYEQLEAAAETIESRLGQIDVWVNNAMVSVFSPVKELRADEVKRVTEVDYLGFVNGTLIALKRMLPRDRGVIVQVGSALAYRGIPLQAAYCGAKHAIQGFTESLRCELLHDRSRIRVTMVQMPGLNTPQFEWVKSRLPGKPKPVPPIYQPEVAARAITWAARHPRREVNVGGSTLATVVGNNLVPELLDRYLARTGYKSQQRAERVSPRRQDNLWQPVSGDHGAHGPFDREATNWSLELWMTERRRLLAPLALLASLAAVAMWSRRTRR